MSKKRATALMPVTSVEYLPPESKKERKAVVVDRELERLYNENQVVTVETVLAEAEKFDSPLHAFFEWDDTKAAKKFRVMQAYALIMSSKFVVQLVENGQVHPREVKESAPVRRLVSAFRGEGFKLRNEALADNDMRKAVIESKKSVLRSWCKGVIDIEELSEIRQSILAQL